MRIGVSGKGGTGKTTIAAALSRVLGRRAGAVLALDADSNPNLALSLGLPREQAGYITAVPPSLGEWRSSEEGEAFVYLTLPLPEIIGEYGVGAPDNVTLLVMGNVDHAGVGCRCNAHAAARGLMGHLFQADAPAVVTDMEAGLEHLGRGTLENADVLLVVVEPYYRALETGRRVEQLARELEIPRIYTVANKIRTAAEETAVRTYCERNDLQLIATLPFDPALLQAEAAGKSLMDSDPGSPFARAVADLADTLAEKVSGGLA